MLTFNRSYDGGTFEESTRYDKFRCLLEFRQQALFNTEHYLSIQEHEMARRYFRLMNWIEDRMRLV